MEGVYTVKEDIVKFWVERTLGWKLLIFIVDFRIPCQALLTVGTGESLKFRDLFTESHTKDMLTNSL